MKCRVMIKDAAAKNFAAIARRLYRIFAFSYFCHRDLFDQYEVRFDLSSLCFCPSPGH